MATFRWKSIEKTVTNDSKTQINKTMTRLKGNDNKTNESANGNTLSTSHRKFRNERHKFEISCQRKSIAAAPRQFKTHSSYLLLFLATTTIQTIFAMESRSTHTRTQQTLTAATTPRYSQPIKMDDEENFRPIIPKDPEYVSRYMFTNEGQYRVFQPVESDLRVAIAMQRHATTAYNTPSPQPMQSKYAPPSTTMKAPLNYKMMTSMTTEMPVIQAASNKVSWHSSSEQVVNEVQGNANQKLGSDFDENDEEDEGNEQTGLAEYNSDEEEEILGTAEPVDDSSYNDVEDNENDDVIASHANKTNNDDNGIADDMMARINTDKELNEIPHQIRRNDNIDYQHNANNTNANHTVTATEQNFNVELHKELRGLEELLLEYVDNFFNKGQYEPMPGLVIELQKNATESKNIANSINEKSFKEEWNEDIDMEDGQKELTNRIKRHVLRAVETGNMRVNIPRALQSGRLLFITGLKKFLWPIWMGLNILKSVLLAMFLPAIIGSFGKLLGKGITSGSAPLFIRPMDTPQELDFRDNNFSFDDDGKFSMADEMTKDGAGYGYQAEASQQQNQYAYNANAINQQALSRYGNNEKQQNLMQDSYLSALQSISSASFKNSQSLSSSSSAGLGGGGTGGGISMTAPNIRNKPVAAANVNTFQTFQKVPASSLLLSNYDPFYSPLLSRLDSVFAQLKLNSENELCREKLICLMYANPAKYAPYSNLVSAQLSRELNELRKPTSDNPDILRFFKYMRAAKDGQDGVDCEQSFAKCTEFKDFDNPAMLSTYNDINKLVQARKIQ